ncbi:hypothetical protein CC86DRAFT_414077 [Ophiobolus disseminans]|uniref:Uncharacterized protein n=1 Tax=Ophiobolus disseminans TaxID=1469910 RepID=A0A6A6ZB36_9PLEO|nr:hypothetical protein CC86DRAFT_414077 [Ophiobolus disseminans]
MGAAYILDNNDAFSEITLAMMMRHKESYLPLAEHLLNFVPCEVMFILEERRSKLRVTILQILYDTATDAGLEIDSRKCICA